MNNDNLKKKIRKVLKKSSYVMKLLRVRELVQKYHRGVEKKSEKYFIVFINFLKNTKIINESDIKKATEKLLAETMLEKMEGELYYSLDVYKSIASKKIMFNNTTVDYSKILQGSLVTLGRNDDAEWGEGIRQSLIKLSKRIEQTLLSENTKTSIQAAQIFHNMNTESAQGFRDALQRILFINQSIWQCGHQLVGLGRLDYLLDKYFQQDIKNNKITIEEGKNLIKDFLCQLHRYYWFKSSALMGDTGQIIILGGLEASGKYFCNELTYLFIEAIEELQLPDPKVLLRVSSNMPRRLMECVAKCIQTGVGSPLLANDEIIIPQLVAFGYECSDAYQYVTSACWEPLIGGKASDQNNIISINYMKPFLDLFDIEDIQDIDSIDSVMLKYSEYLKKYIMLLVETIETYEYEKAPILSLLIDNCSILERDIADGGARYNDSGITTVGLLNVINSLLCLQYFIFEKKQYTLKQINEARKNNYIESDDMRKILKKYSLRFGVDKKEVIVFTNKITKIVAEILKPYRNIFGGKLKIGLSSPAYLSEGKELQASFDGRCNGEPLGVHISNGQSKSFTELVSFASKLEYSDGRFNGNVVDFMVAPSFIDKNFDKFVDFLLLSIKQGFFQMQLNVVSSDILIAAKKKPKQYLNLIVRVWGFSAYFCELPEEYQNILIERALESEGAA